MKRRSLQAWICMLGVGVGVALQWPAVAGARLLPFQGRLTDAQGQVVTNGVRVVQFKVYDAPVGGQAVWSGEVQKLTVNNGLVSTLLGSKASLSGVDFNQNLYIELTLDADNDEKITLADPPLQPRQVILPSVFSIESENSRKLAGADWTSIFGVNDPSGPIPGAKIENGSLPGSKIEPGSITSLQVGLRVISGENLSRESITKEELTQAVIEQLVPTGTIVAFGGTWGAMPSGWILCDGRALPIAGYPRLYGVISNAWGVAGIGEFRVPDFRGIFLRGVDFSPVTGVTTWDPESDQRGERYGGNQGNTVGSFQPDAFQGHFHELFMGSWGISTGNFDNNWLVYQNNFGNRGNGYIRKPTSDGDHGEPRTAKETRPVNAAVNYIIKS